MSLKPKRVDFNQTWHELQETIKGVITLANIPRAIWNDRFRYKIWKLFYVLGNVGKCILSVVLQLQRCLFLVCCVSRATGRSFVRGDEEVFG